MKTRFFLTTLFALCLAVVSCHCQVVMRTLSDAAKIKTAQKNYVGKPLSDLLKDIQIPIKTVTVNQRRDTSEAPGHFFFRFNDSQTLDSIRSSRGYAVGIVVYVKETFTYDYQSRFKNRNFAWKPEDTQRYGHLTIERLRVFTGKKDD